MFFFLTDEGWITVGTGAHSWKVILPWIFPGVFFLTIWEFFLQNLQEFLLQNVVGVWRQDCVTFRDFIWLISTMTVQNVMRNLIFLKSSISFILCVQSINPNLTKTCYQKIVGFLQNKIFCGFLYIKQINQEKWQCLIARHILSAHLGTNSNNVQWQITRWTVFTFLFSGINWNGCFAFARK